MAVPTYFLKTGNLKEEGSSPPVDLRETATEIIIEADLPGVELAALHLTVSDRIVQLEGHYRPETVQGRYLQMERSHEVFLRQIAVPAAIDPHRAVARYERGVLIITIPIIQDRRNTAIKIPIAGT